MAKLPTTISAGTPADAGAGAINITGVIQAILIALIGDLTHQVLYLLLVICIDAILGVWVAINNKSFRLSIFFRETFKKVFVYFLVIALFNAADIMFTTGNLMRWGALLILFVRDLFSSLHHLDKLGFGNIATDLVKLVSKHLPSSSQSKSREDLRNEP